MASQDLDGREDVRRTLAASGIAAGNIVLHSDCVYETLGASTTEDILAQLMMSASGFSYDANVMGALDALEGWVEQSGAPVVLVLSSMDLLPEDDARFMLREVVARLRAAGVSGVLYTSGPGATHNGEDVVVDLSTLSVVEVEAHLRRYTRPSSAHAEAGAGLEYYAYRRLRDSHLTGLAQP